MPKWRRIILLKMLDILGEHSSTC